MACFSCMYIYTGMYVKCVSYCSHSQTCLRSTALGWICCLKLVYILVPLPVWNPLKCGNITKFKSTFRYSYLLHIRYNKTSFDTLTFLLTSLPNPFWPWSLQTLLLNTMIKQKDGWKSCFLSPMDSIHSSGITVQFYGLTQPYVAKQRRQEWHVFQSSFM